MFGIPVLRDPVTIIKLLLSKLNGAVLIQLNYFKLVNIFFTFISEFNYSKQKSESNYFQYE